MTIECCDCGKLYEARPFRMEGVSVPMIECPHCGLQHLMEFTPLRKPDPKKTDLDTIKLGTYYADMGGSRIADITGTTDYSGSDNTPVTDWNKNSEFIVAVNINAAGKNPVASTFQLYWQDLDDGGGYTPLAATGELNYTISDTSWNDGDSIATGDFFCTQISPSRQAGEKTKNTAVTDSIDLADSTESELWFGVHCSGADDGHEYGFQLYATAEGAVIGTLGVTLTTHETVQAATCAETATIGETQVEYIPTEVRTAIFDVPTSAGSTNLTIDGWSGTPKAAVIILVNTDGTDSYDNDSIYGWGVTDGVNQYAGGFVARDALTSTNYQTGVDNAYCVYITGLSPSTYNLTGTWTSWQTGGMSITWGGTNIATMHAKVIVTFFAGENLSADIVTTTGNAAHIESLSFTSKLIFVFNTGFTTLNADTYLAAAGLGIVTNGSNGLTQNCFALNWEDGVSTTNNYTAISGTYGSMAVGVTGSISTQWTFSNIDSVGFNISGGSSTQGVLLCLGGFTEDVDSGILTVPTSGNIAVTDPNFTSGRIGLFSTGNTSLDTGQKITDSSIMWGVIDADGFEGSLSVVSEDSAADTNNTSVHSSNVLHYEDADQNVNANNSSVSSDSDGFDIIVSTHPSTAYYTIWWAFEGQSIGGGPLSGTAAETATINEAQTTQTVFNASCAETVTINEAETVSQITSSTGAETATIDDIPSAATVYNEATDETATINEAETVQITFTGTGSETAIIDETETSIQTSASATEETVSINETETVQVDFQVTGEETSTINDTPSTGTVYNESTAETATIDDASTVQVVFASAETESATIDEVETVALVSTSVGSESATIDDSSAVQVDFNASDSESATIDEAQTAAIGEQSATGEETASINEAETATKTLVAICEETVNINEAETVSQTSTSAGSESATINETQATQTTFNVTTAETATINEAQVADETNAATGEETATIDDTPTVQAVLNDTTSETGTINEAQAASQQFADSGSETATIDDAPDAAAAANVSVAESATINEAQTVQATLNDAGSESATINEAQTADETNASTGEETATINEAQTTQAVLNDTGAETATINDAPAASLVQVESTAESATIDEAETVQANLQAVTAESATIDDTSTTQVNFQASVSEGLNINEAQTATEDNDAVTAETVSIDEAPTTQANLNTTGAESATIDEAQTAVNNVTGEVAETATVDEAQTGIVIRVDTVAESATVDDTPTTLAVLYESITESLNVNEIQSAEGDRDGETLETVSIDEVPTVQANISDTGAESVTIDETNSAIRQLTASVLESLSIDDTSDAEFEAYFDSTAETATIDDVPTVQAVYYADITESVAIGEAVEGANLQNLFNDVYIKGVVKGYTIEGVVSGYTITG